ncbi:MAG: 16S rRNA (cytidine(1402)-2'-O)-methyltransferase [Candidatus Latescibacteria bacterium]|jgi:16S rRNA (cytidine1402-2'-O)-methyltransferase|nr:16S rRNA (cytidine(1402)-2'-O)-methyltransferase [Candidatus Latescibacterota bacterium]
MNKTKKGQLFVVSTPIGNMSDFSQRAIDCLKSANIVACEDTRRTGLLFSRLGFKKKLFSYHNFNELKRTPAIIENLNNGNDVALVSDAGTPGISDPAYRVVRAAVEAGFDVIPVPGPSAVLASLVVSGLPPDRFVFEGFLPPKGAKRLKRIEAMADEQRTIILFESPHKILLLLENILSILGDREISVSREITKLHEETIRGNVSIVLEKMIAAKPRGEYTVVIRGREKRKGK